MTFKGEVLQKITNLNKDKFAFRIENKRKSEKIICAEEFAKVSVNKISL